MKFFLSSILISVSLMAITSCSTNKYTPVNANTPTHEVGYTTHVKPVVDNFCITCHGGESPSGGVSLKDYTSVKYYAEKGNLLKRINDQAHPMPVGGLMPKNERVLFNKWKANGFMEIGKIDSAAQSTSYNWTPKPISAIAIDNQEVQLLTQLQGHWVGDMNLMGEKIPWFAWDYRAIAPNHVHGIFEGGSMGNLFNSIFIADFNGTKTLMARNGGILNGIYRTSYFVLDQAEVSEKESYYRLVDAYGNDQIMWMEFRFKGNQMTLTSYTSRFGTYPKPTKHMEFKGTQMHEQLFQKAAAEVNFPNNELAYDFSNGLPTPIWKEYGEPTSASYLWQDVSKDLETLGELSKDPIPINKMPHVASLKIKWSSDSLVTSHATQLYLSRAPLTHANGQIPVAYNYITLDKMNEVLLFSEINSGLTEFQYHYLHPGDYYLTRWVDLDGNASLSTGDAYQKSIKIRLEPKVNSTILLEAKDYQTL